MVPSRRTRVLIADDHHVVRAGIKALLATAPDLDVVAEAADGREALELAVALEPDVVLMDLAMPVMDGAEATTRIRDEVPCTQVVVLTGERAPAVGLALEGGAITCLQKDARPEALLQAVRDAADGRGSVDSAALRLIIERRRACGSAALTRRELQVLELVVDGLSNRQIAVSLLLGESTVRMHVANILTKLEAPNRTAAAVLAVENALI